MGTKTYNLIINIHKVLKEQEPETTNYFTKLHYKIRGDVNSLQFTSHIQDKRNVLSGEVN